MNVEDEKGGLRLPLDPARQYSFEDLRQVLRILLGEEGCPWDRAQTHESLRQYLLEESYEVVEAVNKKDDESLQEELGDVLFQVLFHGALAEQRGAFTTEDVIDGAVRKMVSRHTHIFGPDKASDPAEVLDVWEKNKEKEKQYKNPREKLVKIPKELPALLRAQKTQEKAAAHRREEKTMEELSESLEAMAASLRNNGDSGAAHQTEQIGEILFQTVQISRVLQINAEFALTNAIETFINRFEYIIDTSENESSGEV